jgi:hypothetical protein
MTFFDNSCLIGQFKCDILSAEYAVNRPILARSEFLHSFGALAETPVNSAGSRQECLAPSTKLSREMVIPTYQVMVGIEQKGILRLKAA